MIDPVNRTAQATVQGTSVDELRDLLDPRKWDERAGDIWRQSYLIVESALSTNLSEDPEPDVPLNQNDIWQRRQLPALLFEDVRFGTNRYRNVLDVTFELTEAQSLQFRYSEYQSLTTVSPSQDEFPGGVDVDSGEARAQAIGKDVKLTFRKTVRFTQPESGETQNVLAQLFVPLALDAWMLAVAFALRNKVNG